jgi:hypothetical protein
VAWAVVKKTVMWYVASWPSAFFTAPPADHPPGAEAQFDSVTS